MTRNAKTRRRGASDTIRTAIWLLVLAAVVVAAAAAAAEEPTYQHYKYQYKHSFKAPHTFKDAEGNIVVPHWSLIGNALPSSEHIRLAPSVRSQQGAVWSDLPVPFENWQVDIGFVISGRGRLGGDGMAFWYTKERGALGSAFGAPNIWDGLGVMFDTYDNDVQRNNPIVYGILNDGSREFSMNSDGSELQFGNCIRSFRNMQGVTHVRIVYLDKNLKVLMDTSESGNAMKECFEENNVSLPTGYYFGVSAATGALADDHDVISFEVQEISQQRPPSDASQAKISEEMLEKLADVEARMDRARKKKEEQMMGDEQYVKGSLVNADEIVNKLVRLSEEQTELKIMLQAVLNRMDRGIGMMDQKLMRNEPFRPTPDGANDIRELLQGIRNQLNDVQNTISILRHQTDDAGNRNGVNDNPELLLNLHQGLKRMETKLESLTSTNNQRLFENIKEDIRGMKSSISEGGQQNLMIFGAVVAVVLVVALLVWLLKKKKDSDSSKKFL